MQGETAWKITNLNRQNLYRLNKMKLQKYNFSDLIIYIGHQA